MNKLPFFHKGQNKDLNFQDAPAADKRIALSGLALIIGGLFLALFVRLFQLTIVKGSYYRRLAEENHTRVLIIEPARGTIVDRKGFVIAQNTLPDIKSLSDRIISNRQYFGGEAIGPLVGYRQVADQNDMKNNQCRIPLQLGDKIGKKGVEEIFDCRLRGRAGKKMIETDAHGKMLYMSTIEPALSGEKIQLALDLDLQKTAFNLIKDQRAAVIVMKPQNGEVFALVSSPSFDPQDFENANPGAVNHYLKDPHQPLFDRATSGTYPPGSLFKLIVAAAGLEEGKITKDTLFEDKGILEAGPLKFGNWYFLQYGKTEGIVDLVKAIQRSNDIYFYQAGQATTPELIKKWALRFGLGKTTGIGLDEAEGLIPSPFWKEATLKDRWYTGDTYNFAIGQGYTLVTPLQMAAVTSAFASGGYLCKPQLLKNGPANCQKLPIAQKNLDLIKKGMTAACATGGTGWPLFNFKVQSSKLKVEEMPVACKTGTAEAQSKDKNPHAWFTAYAPADKPEIVVTVLIENAGQGSDVAAPIAKEIFRTYFERNE